MECVAGIMHTQLRSGVMEAAVVPESREKLCVAARGLRRPVVPERLVQELRRSRHKRLQEDSTKLYFTVYTYSEKSDR